MFKYLLFIIKYQLYKKNLLLKICLFSYYKVSDYCFLLIKILLFKLNYNFVLSILYYSQN